MTTGCPSTLQVENALRTVVDPEISINLMDLGVIYGIHIEEHSVQIVMTFTNPHCPMHEILVAGAKSAVMRIPGVRSCDVCIVLDPPWHPDMMSQSARQTLGS